MIITLDGPSGTGKSTLAKLVANKLGFKFLNTGMLYRAFTYYLITNNINPNNIEEIKQICPSLTVEIKFDGNAQNVVINKINCTPFVSSPIVQQNVSLYSQIPELRAVIVKLQREFSKTNNIVIEGRDIGSEVFPDAEYKFYVDCDVMVRAKRRHEDLLKQNQTMSLSKVIESLKNRDYLDTTRKCSPLVKPQNAIVIDTSNKTVNESLNEILSYINI